MSEYRGLGERKGKAGGKQRAPDREPKGGGWGWLGWVGAGIIGLGGAAGPAMRGMSHGADSAPSISRLLDDLPSSEASRVARVADEEQGVDLLGIVTDGASEVPFDEVLDQLEANDRNGILRPAGESEMRAAMEQMLRPGEVHTDWSKTGLGLPELIAEVFPRDQSVEKDDWAFVVTERSDDGEPPSLYLFGFDPDRLRDYGLPRDWNMVPLAYLTDGHQKRQTLLDGKRPVAFDAGKEALAATLASQDQFARLILRIEHNLIFVDIGMRFIDGKQCDTLLGGGIVVVPGQPIRGSELGETAALVRAMLSLPEICTVYRQVAGGRAMHHYFADGREVIGNMGSDGVAYLYTAFDLPSDRGQSGRALMDALEKLRR